MHEASVEPARQDALRDALSMSTVLPNTWPRVDQGSLVVSFTQRPFMLPFIKYCNEGRKNATSEFESSLYKLLANAFYGKTVENVRKRANVRLICDPNKLVKAVAKASYKRSQIINADLALVENMRSKIHLTKPIAIGCTILEIAKLIMYEFYYDCLVPKFGDKLRLCFTERTASSATSNPRISSPIFALSPTNWTRQTSNASTRCFPKRTGARWANSRLKPPTFRRRNSVVSDRKCTRSRRSTALELS